MVAEAWLSGPVEGVPDGLQPAAHALLDALADIELAVDDLPLAALWARPGGAASVGFHLKHVAGSTDRLITYARGEPLTTEQRAAIDAEGEPGDPPAGAAELLADLRATIERAIAAYRATPERTLRDAREVGRARLPSTVQGLLYHAADHARRHGGQVVATAKIVTGAVDEG